MARWPTARRGRSPPTGPVSAWYRAPVPLQTPLRLTGRVTEVLTRKVIAYGTIATAAEPDTVLVEATGTFVAIRPEKVRALFGPMRHP